MESLQSLSSLTVTQISFYIVSVLTLFGALGTILSKNPIHSVIYLILTFFSLSAHYVLMNAQFLAAVNIIVYAGAIMVLFLFVVMFLNIKQDDSELTDNKTLFAAGTIGILLAGILVLAIRLTKIPPTNAKSFDSTTGFIENLGSLLFSRYLLPFELVSVLFLIAMAGAVMLGKREKGERNF